MKSVETLCARAGDSDGAPFGAVAPPLILSTTFAQNPASANGHETFEYARASNPTRLLLEETLAALEGGTHAFAFASGCAAITAVLLSLGGDAHVVLSRDAYGGTQRLLGGVFHDFGIRVTPADLTDLRALASAMLPDTRLVWVETPTNPRLDIVDLAEVARMAHARGALVAVDNTFATPILQRPLELGADLVVHSTTKYLNGHSDVVGGAVVTREPRLAERLAYVQRATGGVASPFDAYLVLRGIKTLALRMERHVATAGRLARWLTTRPEVARVYYPGLAEHPAHALARRQMKGGGGIVTIELGGGESMARALLANTRLFTCAISLGGVESLAEHPASMSHARVPAGWPRPDSALIRLSPGLESATELEADLAQALERAVRG